MVADVGKCLRRRDGRMDSWVIDLSRRGPSLRFPFISRGAVAPGGRFEPISAKGGRWGRWGGGAAELRARSGRPTHHPRNRLFGRPTRRAGRRGCGWWAAPSRSPARR